MVIPAADRVAKKYSPTLLNSEKPGQKLIKPTPLRATYIKKAFKQAMVSQKNSIRPKRKVKKQIKVMAPMRPKLPPVPLL